MQGQTIKYPLNNVLCLFLDYNICHHVLNVTHNSLISYELTNDIGLQEKQLTFFFIIPK